MANDSHTIAKISGYLEKKGKLRIGSSWKKYWFVLEGRLLLYYRSKDEYEAISPCKGSINLCPPCNVKPALSAAGVFQIECRASTITLRAEDRSEQERWMQGILAAIAHSRTSTSRMSHFRYSLDELPTPVEENNKKKTEGALTRQHTMPHRVKTPQKGSKEMIDRLQNIGAQTYGGSIGTISKLANKDKVNTTSPKLPQNQNVSKLLQNSNITTSEEALYASVDKRNSKSSSKSNSSGPATSIIVDNTEYSTCEDIHSPKSTTSDSHVNCLDRVTSVIIDNVEYSTCEEVEASTKDRVTSIIIDNVEYSTCEGGKPSGNSQEGVTIRQNNPNNLNAIVDNDTYCKGEDAISNIYERISADSTFSRREQRVNEEYATVYDKDNETYSVPETSKDQQLTDHNKNSLILENDQYLPTGATNVENCYSPSPNLYDDGEAVYDAIDKTEESEDIYAVVDTSNNNTEEQREAYQYIEPLLPPRPEFKKLESCEDTISQASSNNSKSKKKYSRFKKWAHFGKSEKKDSLPSKKKGRSASFMRRVWKGKSKSLDSEETLYESVDYNIVKTPKQSDLQMLSELENILKTRKKLLETKIKTGNARSPKEEANNDKSKPKMEEEKLEILEEGSHSETRPTNRPLLPPRQNSRSISPYHDVPTNNQPISESANGEPKTITTNEAEGEPEVKTIDEILEDLDKEKTAQDSKQKFKQLLEKFNRDEVVLRKKPVDITITLSRPQSDFNTQMKHDCRDSEELNRLLEELAKVTSAPILTPGVTTSLVTPILTDDELLKLIPIRRRRLSDPDYDVPRPHRSLQLGNRSKNVEDNPIPVTRFFGPVLPPTTLITNPHSIPWSSMDPDSLEVENLPAAPTKKKNAPLVPSELQSTIERDHSVSSYTSHDYFKENPRSFPETTNFYDKVVYAQPKLFNCLTKIKTSEDEIISKMDVINENNHIIDPSKTAILDCGININGAVCNLNKNDESSKHSETFIDSLEPFVEASTVF